MSGYQGKITSEVKSALSNEVARQLGWESLNHDTRPKERKFNIWLFYDKTLKGRDIETKQVTLLAPLPPRRKQTL